MEETKVYRLDYRRLNRVCTYCTKPSTVIKVITTTGGDILVGTLCDLHAKGEQEHFRKNDGLVMAGKDKTGDARTDATLIDPNVLREMASGKLAMGKGVQKLLADAADSFEDAGKSDKDAVPLDPNGPPGERGRGDN